MRRKIKKRSQEQSQHTKYTLQNACVLAVGGPKFNSKLWSSNTKRENDHLQDSECPYDKNKPGEAQLFLVMRTGRYFYSGFSLMTENE